MHFSIDALQRNAEGLEDAVEDALGFGDGHAVVGDGDASGLGLVHAPEHKGAVDHAPAAVDDQGVLGEFLGEVFAGDDLEGEFLAGFLADPTGDFDTADIVLGSVVGACFANENTVAILQVADGGGTSGQSREVALEARHQD